MLRVCQLSLIAAVFGAVTQVDAQIVSRTGRIIRADEGQRLVFCTSPGLSVKVHVDSVAGGSTRMASGTAELVGENFGTHGDVDEIVYFLSDNGRFALAADTFDVRSGTIIFVPQGVRHGFISKGEQPLRFFWVIAPGALAARFREHGRPDYSGCAEKR